MRGREDVGVGRKLGGVVPSKSPCGVASYEVDYFELWTRQLPNPHAGREIDNTPPMTPTDLNFQIPMRGREEPDVRELVKRKTTSKSPCGVARSSPTPTPRPSSCFQIPMRGRETVSEIATSALITPSKSPCGVARAISVLSSPTTPSFQIPMRGREIFSAPMIRALLDGFQIPMRGREAALGRALYGPRWQLPNPHAGSRVGIDQPVERRDVSFQIPMRGREIGRRITSRLG